MNNLNIQSDLQLNKLSNWRILFLRWLLGGFAGIVLSSWIYFGFKNDAFPGAILWVLEMLFFLFIPFVGHLYLFYTGASFTHVNDFLMTFPVLFCGLIGALLASGRKSQMITGIILLLLFVVIGCSSFFLGALRVPT